jgi:thiamine-phosphate pyrophosphorylase
MTLKRVDQTVPVDYLAAPLGMRGLYAIVDVGTLATLGLDPLAFGEAVLSVQPAALQLRAKSLPARETLVLLRELAPKCRRAGVPLVANDRPDLAIFAGCDLVHVGQTDVSIDRVRRLAPTMRVGVSTHTIEQLDAALAARPAYVAFGPVFETSTKENPDPVVGVEALVTAHARAVEAGVPLVAIGGITLERARGLVGKAEAVAVISQLLPRKPAPGENRPVRDVVREVAERARALNQLFAADMHQGAGSRA